jgi:hypothetical protein
MLCRGGAFAEWDYLRGVREGWIPKTERDVASVDRFGTCEDIIFKTSDDISIVHEFPDPLTLPEGANWQGVAIDDDLVVSHGQSLIDNTDMDDDQIVASNTDAKAVNATPVQHTTEPRHHHFKFYVFVASIVGMFIYRFGNPLRRSRQNYHSLDAQGGPVELHV